MRTDRARKPDRHNLLEDLLITGIEPCRAVPPESGVRFYIGSEVASQGACLVFCIDWKGTPPLLPASGPKADYLVLFIPFGGGPWIATVIELKGREHRNQRHGLEQIRTTIEVLRREVEEHIPRRIRFRWQGVLLHAGGSQIPLEQLRERHPPVRAVPYHHAVDLRELVTVPVQPGAGPTPLAGRNRCDPKLDFGAIERVFARGTRSHDGGPTVGGLHVRAIHEAEECVLDVVAARPVIGISGSRGVLVQRDRLCPPGG